jgi:hypothetical protein
MVYSTVLGAAAWGEPAEASAARNASRRLN